MNKALFYIIISSLIFVGNHNSYSTTAVVTLIGAKIRVSQKEPIIVKYKRKDCPICKGKGWYMSGDDIKKIECTYCEPNNESKN